MTTLKAKVKEKMHQTVAYVNNHREEILGVGITLITLGILAWLATQPSDEENENGYNYNFDSDSTVEIDKSRDSQTDIQVDPPKRFIGDIDITRSRLKANEKQFLEAFSAQYDRFKGIEQTVESKFTGWSSEGKYTRYTKTNHSFGNDKMSITVDESYEDDDGQTDTRSLPVELKARNIINYVRGNRDLEMFDGVRDIVNLL